MIIYMCNCVCDCACELLCVTNRLLCQEDFLQRIEKIARCHPAGIILREKDLSESEYEQLARQVLKICKKYQVTCILHSFVDASVECNVKAIHLPLHILREMDSARKVHFKVIGASCHSVEDALEAERLGCTYITAGHIFATDCKKGLPGRGLDFLQKVCKSVSIPVYAIGGIDCGNIAEIRKAGAKGACVMSGAMQCEDVEAYIKSFYE